MLRTALALLSAAVVLVVSAPDASAGDWEHRCYEVKWHGDSGAERMLNKFGSDGWRLGAFLKGSIPCFKRDRSSSATFEYRCATSRWRGTKDLNAFVDRRTVGGWELVGSSRPSQICMIRQANGARAERDPSGYDSNVPAVTKAAPRQPAPVQETPVRDAVKPAAPLPTPKTPEDNVRDRAAKAHQELKEEEQK